MADRETELGWEKSKRIEAEKMKAAKMIAKEKPDRVNLAFLGPKATKVKGWSADPDVIFSSGERMGNWAIVLAFCGVVLNFIGSMGAVVSSTFKLGLAGVALSVPSIIGIFGMGLAVLMAVVAIGCEIYFKIKRGRRFSVAFWSSIWAIGIVVLYIAIRWLIIRFS